MRLRPSGGALGLDAQRYYNLLCLAYGSDPKYFGPAVQKNHLPEDRAEGCREEYHQALFAVQKLIAPSIDPRDLERQRWVLARMRTNGTLDAASYGRALDERIRLVREAPGLLAPHFVEQVLAGAGTLPPVRRIETTLDAGLQAEVAGILRMHRARLREAGAFNAAVAVLDNASAEWRAWEGSGD